MENQNNTPEKEKKKNKVDYIGIIYAVGCVYLFGPLPGLCGVVAAELLKRNLEKKNPGKGMYTVISYVVGAVAALALNIVLGILLRSI